MSGRVELLMGLVIGGNWFYKGLVIVSSPDRRQYTVGTAALDLFAFYHASEYSSFQMRILLTTQLNNLSRFLLCGSVQTRIIQLFLSNPVGRAQTYGELVDSGWIVAPAELSTNAVRGAGERTPSLHGET